MAQFKSIVVDTFTAFQKNEILQKWENGKANHDDWKDYGVDIVLFLENLIKRGFTLVGVLGYEGTGKSFGMKTLESGTNIWFNADRKNPTWKGGKEEYGIITAPKNIMQLPITYKNVLDVIDIALKGNAFVENRVAFLIAHIEDYKSTDGTIRQRLKTLGKLANKINIEDKLTMCYYTEVKKEGNKVSYNLRTQNSGNDTCRTNEGLHEDLYISNDFKLILDAIEQY